MLGTVTAVVTAGSDEGGVGSSLVGLTFPIVGVSAISSGTLIGWVMGVVDMLAGVTVGVEQA